MGGCFPPLSPSPLLPSSPSCTPPETTGWGTRGCHEESKSRTPTFPLLWRLWACLGPRELQEEEQRSQIEDKNRHKLPDNITAMSNKQMDLIMTVKAKKNMSQ